MAGNERIHVELVYALPDAQHLAALELAVGSTARIALEHSGFLHKYPEIDLEKYRIGIFGRLVKPEQVLSDGQRLEIYRPLIRDPKQARRERAEHNKRAGKSVR